MLGDFLTRQGRCTVSFGCTVKLRDSDKIDESSTVYSPSSRKIAHQLNCTSVANINEITNIEKRLRENDSILFGGGLALLWICDLLTFDFILLYTSK